MDSTDFPGAKGSQSNDGERSVSIGGDVTGSVIVTGDVTVNPQGRSSVLVNNIMAEKLEDLASAYSEKIAEQLERHREAIREGRTEAGYGGILELRGSDQWASFDERLKASILRALSVAAIVIEGGPGLEKVKAYAAEAREHEPEFNDQSLRLRLQILEHGPSSVTGVDDFDSTETYNLWLVCLLNQGRSADVILNRANPPANVALNAETHRIYALAFLALKDLAGAKSEMAVAVAEAPNWQNVRYTEAIVKYFSSLSPMALPDGLPPSPQPVFGGWVKVDDESQRVLREAAAEFASVTDLFPEGSTMERECRIWQFASLANTLEQEPEAIDVGRQLLAEDPANSTILSWFVSRRYPHDFQASREAVGRSDQPADPVTYAVTQVSLDLHLGEPDAALDALEAARPAFERTNNLDYWRYWRGQALLSLDRPDEAEAEAAGIGRKELTISLRIRILSVKGAKTGHRKELLAFLKKNHKECGDADSFIAYYEENALQGADKRFMARNAMRYCDAIVTAPSVDFVVRSLWNTGRRELCLDLLDKYRGLFPGGKLPESLRRLHVQGLIARDIHAALSEARSLAHEENNAENILLLMDVHLEKGDLAGLQAAARTLLHRDGVTARDLLRAAHLVKITDRFLAEKFWKKALEAGIPEDPHLVAFAQGIAYKLGLEKESRGLMEKLTELARKGVGPMKQMSFRNAVKEFKRNVSATENVDKLYGEGVIPVHFWAKHRNISLGEIFFRLARANGEERDVRRRLGIMTRNGSRVVYPTESFANAKNWRLHLDVTSILVAHDLGILDHLENLFRPIRISRQVVTGLVEQRDGLIHHQKKQLDSSRVVCKVHADKKLKLAAEASDEELAEVFRLAKEQDKPDGQKRGRGNTAKPRKKTIRLGPDRSVVEAQLGDRLGTIAKAVAEDGIAVGFLPLTAYNSEDMAELILPAGIAERIANARLLTDSLRAHGRIDDELYRSALEALGVEGRVFATDPLEPGAKLFLMPDVETLSADAGILQPLCETFEVYASLGAVSFAEQKVLRQTDLEEVDVWVNDLLTRISNGLDEGRYEYIHVPEENARKAKAAHKRKDRFDREIAPAMDLLLYEAEEGDVICIDDRWLSRYPIRKEGDLVVPLIGVYELLQFLFAKGEIGEHKFYGYLLDMRKRNHRYIPLTAEEILFHLKRATVNGGVLVETEPLRVIRQYFASCLLDREFLRMSATEDGKTEAAFVFQSIESVGNALALLWGDPTAEETTYARADWLLENVYTGTFGESALSVDGEHESDELTALCADVSAMLVRGILFMPKTDIQAPNEERLGYFGWLAGRILPAPVISTPGVKAGVARLIRDQLRRGHESTYPSKQERFFSGYLMGRFFLDLPDPIRDEIELDESLSDWLRVKSGSVVTVGPNNFDAGEYWYAVEKALAGEKAGIWPIESDEPCHFVADSSDDADSDSPGPPGIAIFNEQDERVGGAYDPSFAALLSTPEERLSALWVARHWFDCDDPEFKRLTREISDIPNTLERVTRLYEIGRGSVETHYTQLELRLRRGERVTWSDLHPPPLPRLLGHYRIPHRNNEPFEHIWRNAGTTLLREEGLRIAVLKASNLPLRMPESVLAGFLALPSAERLELLRELSVEWASPLRLLHAANLALRSMELGDDEALELAAAVLKRIYQAEEEGGGEFDAFMSVLDFVSDSLGQSAGEEIDPRASLFASWAHACGLFHIQKAMGHSPNWMIESFGRRLGRNALRSIEKTIDHRSDCLSTARVARSKFLTHAAANLFRGIGRERLDSAGVIARVREETFRQNLVESESPALALLNDPLLCSDLLDSLFGGDRFEVLEPVIGGDNIESFKSEELARVLGAHLEGLNEKPQDVKSWLLAYIIANDLPLYPHLRDTCREALSKFDSEFLASEASDNPSFLLFSAAGRVADFDDDWLRSEFRGHILNRLRALVKQVESDNILENMRTLVDAALSACRSNDPAVSTRAFVALLESMLDIWPDLKLHCGRLIGSMTWDSNFDLGRSWWRLNLRLRMNPCDA